MKTATLFLFILTWIPALVWAKDCTLAEVYGSCEALQTSGPILKKNADGTLIPNFYRALSPTGVDLQDPQFLKGIDELRKDPKDRDANIKRIDRQIEYIRNIYLNEILKGRKENDPNLDSATRSMVQRLKSIRVEQRNGIYCDSTILGAFYSPTLHTLLFCTPMTKLPDSALLFIMAHEMAHSLDSCNLSKPLLKVKKKLPAGKCKSSEVDELQMINLEMNLGQWVIPNNTVTAKTMVDCGYADVFAEAPMTPAKNLIGQATACVVNYEKQQTNLKAPKALDSFKEKIKIQLQQGHPDWTESQVADEIQSVPVQKYYEEYQLKVSQFLESASGCKADPLDPSGVANAAEERTADTLATIVMKKYISEKNLTDLEKRNAIEVQAQLACTSRLANKARFETSDYPTGDARLNILLQEPEFQKAFNCTYREPTTCSIEQLRNPQAVKSSEATNKSDKGTK